MKIGIDARLFSDKIAGIGHYTNSLYQHLTKIKGIETVLYSDQRFSGMRDPARIKSRGLRKISYIIWLNTEFPRILREDAIDIVHAPNFVPPFRGNTPSVATFHDLGFLRYPETHHGLYAALFPSLVNRAVDKARLIITPSKSSRDEIIYYYPRAKAKIRVIYEAASEVFKKIVDTSVLDEVRRKFRLPEKFILCVGTLEPRKNLEIFFIAFKRFLEYAPNSDLRLVLCGKSWIRHREFLKELSNSGIADRVLMTGYVEQNDLVGIYNCALALAFPSYYEGFGIPAVEAMKCGLPVIASDAFSLPEVLGEAALYFDPFDIEEMTQSIQIISSDPAKRGELSELGSRRAQMFSWDETARQTLEVYREALGI